MSPRRGSTPRLTDRQSLCDFDFDSGQAQTEKRDIEQRHREHTQRRETEKREPEERSKTQIKEDPRSRSKEEP
jgi:hypothetical protein